MDRYGRLRQIMRDQQGVFRTLSLAASEFDATERDLIDEAIGNAEAATNALRAAMGRRR